MNERDIELAIEAGFDGRREWPPMYKKFADILRADEREACARVVDAIEARCIAEDIDDKSLAHVAAAIRARSET